MERLLWRKLQPPSTRGLLPRPRLLDLTRDLQFLVVQAPPGAGKTAFLAQWLEAAGRPAVCYSLDEHDRDGRSFAAHVSAGFRKLWPDWEPPAGAVAAPADLAAELVSEAGYRPPAALALDGLEAAFGQAYLADFLAALLRYAPPTLTLVLSSRAPLPVDLSLAGNGQGAVRAADLAFTPAEAEEWLGPDTGWQEPMRTTEGYPLALALWKQQGPGWQAALTVRLTEALPPHADPEVGKALVREWLGGRLLLTTFAHQLSCAEPGVDQLWREVHEVRIRFGIDPIAAKEPLDALWDRARGEGNRKLIGAVALLQGEFWNARGEYGLAMESWRRAFEADPILELTGPHSVVLELRDQGYLEEAEALARRCVAARVDRGDLQALAFARFQHAAVLLELDRLEEAEQEFSEAQRLAGSMGADPFYAIVSVVHRALLEAVRGNGAAFRRLAEEGYAMARDRRSPFFEAMCGHVLAVALLMWGEREPAMHLLAASLDYLTRAQAKWHLHVVHLVYTRLYWAAGQIEAARRHLDEALGLAARQGYIQYLITPRSRSLPLVTDALIRSVEPAFCQEILARMGLRALPALLEMTGHTDPATRRAALYPLAALGGSEAATAIRQLLYDPDESVRDTALLALRSLGPGALPATPAPPPASVTADEPAAPTVAIGVLGPMQVRAGKRSIQTWRTTKSRDLLAYLVLSGRRPVPRDVLLEALWPDVDPESGLSLLHTSLYYLRRALSPEAANLITFAGGAYRLDWNQVALDLDRLAHLVAAGGEQAWREAVSQYQGDLLEGIDYPWCEAPRARVRTLFLDALRSLAGHLIGTGRHAEAVERLQLLVQADPLAEDGHLALMECYTALGNRPAALQQYRALCRVLDDELGLEPGAKAQDLYRKLLD